MCEDETGGAFWCNDSNTTKTKLWRDLAEAAGEIFTQCHFGGIRTQGQIHVEEDSRVIVTHPIPFSQACNLSYNDTMKTRGEFEGIWPEDLEDPYPRRVAQNRRPERQLVSPQAPTAEAPGFLNDPFPEVSGPLGAECSSVVGRPMNLSHGMQLHHDVMGEYKHGKKCVLGPKQCRNMGCNRDTAVFFWCNDSMEKRKKLCWEPMVLALEVMRHCEGRIAKTGQGKTGGTYHDGDERVFVFRPIDGKCELAYERTQKKSIMGAD